MNVTIRDLLVSGFKKLIHKKPSPVGFFGFIGFLGTTGFYYVFVAGF